MVTLATFNMASAASGFVLKFSLILKTSSTPRNSVSFSSKHGNNISRRLVVRAAEEEPPLPPPPPEASTTTSTAPAEGEAKPAPKAPKPPPIGPKRGAKVLFYNYNNYS